MLVREKKMIKNFKKNPFVTRIMIFLHQFSCFLHVFYMFFFFWFFHEKIQISFPRPKIFNLQLKIRFLELEYSFIFISTTVKQKSQTFLFSDSLEGVWCFGATRIGVKNSKKFSRCVFRESKAQKMSQK